MNTQTIRNLRRKFVLIAMMAYILMMLFIGSTINLYNRVATTGQIRSVLNYLTANGGIFADPAERNREGSHKGSSEGTEIALEAFSPEFRYSIRYFSVRYNSEGEIIDEHLSHVAMTSDEEARALASEAYSIGRRYGSMGDYFYELSHPDEETTLAVFVNCASQLRSNDRFLRSTMTISFLGLIITFLLVNLLSYRAIQPELETIRRQKQFITNASHELKTPLAVIRANTEIAEMMDGENEWTQSTMRQVDRLNGLVQNLVMISRAQEREDKSSLSEINASVAVEETVAPYDSLAQQDKKTLVRQIPPDIKWVGDESKIRQLTSLLVDNAFKYCDEEGTITIRLGSVKKGKQLRLTVSNSFKDGAGVDFSRFFERFYREDDSHNIDRGGYGIGLSIAESICQQTGGSISVSWKNNVISFNCILM